MEKLQLDTKGMHLIDGTDAFQQVKPGFPGESEDQMDDKGKPSGMELCCSIIKYGGRISPADPCCSVVMNGLQTKLDPDNRSGYSNRRRSSPSRMISERQSGRVAMEMPATSGEESASS